MPNRPRSLRILHVIPSLSAVRGGPSQAVVEMVAALRKSGINAEIATTNDDGVGTKDVPLGELTEYRGVPVRFFKRLSPPSDTLREFSYSYSFERWLKTRISDYDALHVHAIFSFCSSRAMQLARRHNIPYVVRPIGQLERWSLNQSARRKAYYLKWIERRNLEQADCVQFTAGPEQAQAGEILPELNSTIIPLGLALPMEVRGAVQKMQKRWRLQRETPTLLYLSRLHPKKGLELLLEAAAQLQHLSFQLVVAGSGDDAYLQVLRSLVDALGLQQRVHFIGFVQGAEKSLLLQGADLFALTSHSENFGIAVLEAMASGTAVLVSDKVALSEQVRQNKMGFVTALDVPEIRTKLELALSDLEATRNVGEKARLFVEQNHQWPRIAQQLSSVYQRITT